MHRSFHTTSWLASALLCAGVFSGGAAFAQVPAAETAATQAQMRYEARIAQCNTGNLPAPQRAACVRSAGAELDAARVAPATAPTLVTGDGRATVVTPSTNVAPVITPNPATVTNGITTPDGRATVIPNSVVQ
ncbi:hypothetical protein ACO2Q9_17390 [Variovorax sp. VNK109]|uniref:hypothetical protein n=1 Tax=Variovorax sp. VNK109 TaxID=3400919 RepID=UPI003C04A773